MFMLISAFSGEGKVQWKDPDTGDVISRLAKIKEMWGRDRILLTQYLQGC